jgi:hypothetical protein
MRRRACSSGTRSTRSRTTALFIHSRDYGGDVRLEIFDYQREALAEWIDLDKLRRDRPWGSRRPVPPVNPTPTRKRLVASAH